MMQILSARVTRAAVRPMGARAFAYFGGPADNYFGQKLDKSSKRRGSSPTKSGVTKKAMRSFGASAINVMPSSAVVEPRSKPAGLRKLRVGGVPEHFNAPFLLSIERGLYEAHGIDVEWSFWPGGTGAMAQGLEDGELDIAIMLTEGAIAKVANGAPMRVVGTYVASPLCWGVHTKADAASNCINDLKGKTYGVSRMGSGSHLMAFVDARARGWNPETDINLKIVGSLQGARDAMESGEIDAFMWEKFTTKHLVDTNEWKRVGVVPTPWSCFSFVARNEVVADIQQMDDIGRVVDTTRAVCQEFKRNDNDSTLKYVSEHHKMSEFDASEWLSSCEWDCSMRVESDTLSSIVTELKALDLIKPETSAEHGELVGPTTGVQEVKNDRVEITFPGLNSFSVPVPGAASATKVPGLELGRRGFATKRVAVGRRGFATAAVAAKKPIAAQEIIATRMASDDQPAFPMALHDSLQYHFFADGFFVSVRVFHTPTVARARAWTSTLNNAGEWESKAVFDASWTPTEELWDHDGNMITIKHEVNSGSNVNLHLSSEGTMDIVDGPDAKSLSIRARDGSKILEIDMTELAEQHVANVPTYQEVPAIHRPGITATIAHGGKVHQARGYSKRFSLDKEVALQYSFVQGVAGDAALWSTEASVGDVNYNYFKVLSNGTVGDAAQCSHSVQSTETSVTALVNNKEAKVDVEVLSEQEWSLKGRDKVDSRITERFGKLTFSANGQSVTGFGVSETCVGTLGATRVQPVKPEFELHM